MFTFTSIVRAALLVGSLLPTVRSATIEVAVGANGLKYDPEFVVAAPGDLVRFTFRSKNHTVSQSTFEAPCVRAPGGFDTGFIPVDPALTDGFPTAELPISSTDPIWVFCNQGTHCSAGGMVFAINPGDQFANFKANAVSAAPPAGSASSAAPSATPSAPASPSASSAPAAPSGTGTTHTVRVGEAGGLTFSPTNVKAAVGDRILFTFASKNHSLTQSSLNSPCSSNGGFDSGFQFVDPGLTSNFPQYEITINSTEAIWAYCAQGQHCANGMVFSVNAADTGDRSFQAFQDRAKATAQGGNGGYGSPNNDGSAASISISFIGGAAALLASALLL